MKKIISKINLNKKYNILNYFDFLYKSLLNDNMQNLNFKNE